MLQKTVSGLFTPRSLGAGAWQLATAAAAGPEILLRGTGADAAAVFRDGVISSVALEWRADGVRVALTGEKGIRVVRAQTALVHEPQPRLYDSLPLAAFDADAQRFWQRVFAVMRLPGGRHLLRFLARRRRPRRTPGP
jgi:hypothetical protein